MRRAVVEVDDNVGAGPASIRYHYDQGNDFFALWLDPSMTYSAASWAGADDELGAAQRRKLDYLIEQARAHTARRVLDIGCGWGSLMQRLVEEHSVREVVGITLSQAQVAHIEAAGDPRIDARLQDWKTFEPTELFDAIISIETVEHFVGIRADEASRARTYREFFERCRGWLPLGGRLVVQVMARGQVPLDRRALRDLLLLMKVYPNTGPPSLGELVRGCEGLFEVVSVRNDRLDYARTLMVWKRALCSRRESAAELVGEDVVDAQERAFTGMARHFMLGQGELLRMSFSAI